MEQEKEKKIDNKEKLILFFLKNRLKFLILFFMIISIFLLILFINYNDKKVNEIISTKYIQAGLLLTSAKKEQSLKIYSEIINSKNKFYALLALNTILEKRLVTDEKILTNLIEKVEKFKFTKDEKDLLNLKKALFLINNSRVEQGNKLLREIINSDSKIKSIAEEILVD